LLVNLFSPHPEGLAHPSTLEMLRTRKRTPIFSLYVVFAFELIVESIKELVVHKKEWVNLVVNLMT
jgi:hypothetical protein